MLEGLISVGVFFVLLTIVVQLGFLAIARSAAGGAVDAAARRAALPGSDEASEEARVSSEVASIAPGVSDVAVDVVRSSTTVTVSATFRWSPPGPDLLPVRIAVRRSEAVVVPP